MSAANISLLIAIDEMLREDSQMSNMISMFTNKVKFLRMTERLTGFGYEISELDVLDAITKIGYLIYDPRYNDAQLDPLDNMTIRNIKDIKQGLIDKHRTRPLTEIGRQVRDCFNQLSQLLYCRMDMFNIGMKAASKIIESYELLHDMINEYLDVFEIAAIYYETAPAA